MSSRFAIIIGLLVGAFALIYMIWMVLNNKKMYSRSSFSKKRKSDQAPLNRAQKKIYKNANELYNHGNIRGAAQLLESLNLTREAVSMLEKGGFIKEAASALLRIRRPNRAGAVYARHGMWNEAANCFTMANMPLEVAKCAREAGDLKKAVEYFTQCERFEEAAECYADLGDMRNAARLYAQIGKRDKSIEMLESLIESADNIKGLIFNPQELRIIIDHALDGHFHPQFADVLVNHDKVVEVIVAFVRRDKVKEASELYLRSTSDIGPALIANSEFTTLENEAIARLFIAVSNFEYAGMVYERLGNFASAGEAFEKAEDFERAAYCFDRAGLQARSVDARCKLAAQGGKPKKASAKSPPDLPKVPSAKNGNASHFALGDMTNTQASDAIAAPNHANVVSLPDFANDDEEESTKIIEAAEEEETAQNVIVPPFDTQNNESALSLMLDEVPRPFRDADFLEDLDQIQCELLWRIGETRNYQKGSVLLDFGEEGKGVFFLLQGSVACFRLKHGSEENVDEMHPAATFGEFWLLVDMPTQVKFVATSSCEIRYIGREEFTTLLDKNGTIARKLYKRFTQRLVNKLVTPQTQSINKLVS